MEYEMMQQFQDLFLLQSPTNFQFNVSPNGAFLYLSQLPYTSTNAITNFTSPISSEKFGKNRINGTFSTATFSKPEYSEFNPQVVSAKENKEVISQALHIPQVTIPETVAPVTLPTTVTPKSPSFTDKLGSFASGNIGSTVTNGLNAAANIVNGFQKPADYDNVTNAADNIYDLSMEIAGKFGPIGKVVQLAGAANKVLGGISNLAFGKSEGSKADGIMNSAFFASNIGMINNAFGKHADTFAKNTSVETNMRSDYGTSYNTMDDAVKASGKKHGFLGNMLTGSLGKANRLIAEAKRLQNTIEDINDTAQDRYSALQYNSAMNGYLRSLQLEGGFLLDGVHYGKHGMRIQRIMRTVQDRRHEKSNKVSEELNEYTKLINPEIFESDIQEYKIGGKFDFVEVSLISPEILDIDFEFKEVSNIQEYKAGGKFNVIPEGALHARLNHMDVDNITKKGIPVVSEDENGNIEQHAEIENSEIILRLDLTKKLEEMEKQYYSDNITEKEKGILCIEAGKLLVDEILNNTIDNTNKFL